MTSTREEGEALVATFENASGVHMAHSELLMHVAAGSIQELARLARLGLKVLHPTEDELMRVAGHLYELEHGSDNTPFAEVCLSESQREYWFDQARASLAALRDGE